MLMIAVIDRWVCCLSNALSPLFD